MDLKNLQLLKDYIEGQACEKNRNLLNKFPLQNYITMLDNQPSSFAFGDLSEECKNYCNSIMQAAGDHALSVYHRLLLLTLVEQNHTVIYSSDSPDEIRRLYDDYFEKIIQQVLINEDEFYRYSNDKFCKDLALCRLKMIPVGAVIMEQARFPKRFLVKKGVGQFVQGICFIVRELKVLWPLYQMHLDSRPGSASLAEFNPDGWKRTFVIIAELLKTQPHIRGAFGSGWFCDPALEAISPNLSFTWQLFVNNGGKLFYNGTSKACIHDALLKSPTRRRFYKEGLYKPSRYILAWSRDKLIQWAEGLTSEFREERRIKPEPPAKNYSMRS
jgi:hypothetical protein